MLRGNPSRKPFRQSRKAPTTRPITAEIASFASGRHPLSRSFPLAEARQQRRPAESVAPQISQHSPPGLLLLKDGDMDRRLRPESAGNLMSTETWVKVPSVGQIAQDFQPNLRFAPARGLGLGCA